MAMNLFGIDDETQDALDTYSRMPVQAPAEPRKKRGPFGFLEDLLSATVIGQRMKQVRDRREIDEQMKTLVDNPFETIRNLARAGQGTAALELYDTEQKRKIEELKANAVASKDNATTRKLEDEVQQLRRERFGGQLAGVADDPKQYQRMYPFLDAQAQQFGIMLPAQHDEAAINATLGEFIRPEKRYEADAQQAYRRAQTAIARGNLALRAGALQVEGIRTDEDIRNKRSQREARDTETEIIRRTGKRPGTDSTVTHKGKAETKDNPPKNPPAFDGQKQRNNRTGTMWIGEKGQWKKAS